MLTSGLQVQRYSLAALCREDASTFSSRARSSNACQACTPSCSKVAFPTLSSVTVNESVTPRLSLKDLSAGSAQEVEIWRCSEIVGYLAEPT